MIKWTVWILLASFMIFGGWILKDKYRDLGGAIMGLGFVLAGGLLIIAAYKNLK